MQNKSCYLILPDQHGKSDVWEHILHLADMTLYVYLDDWMSAGSYTIGTQAELDLSGL